MAAQLRLHLGGIFPRVSCHWLLLLSLPAGAGRCCCHFYRCVQHLNLWTRFCLTSRMGPAAHPELQRSTCFVSGCESARFHCHCNAVRRGTGGIEMRKLSSSEKINERDPINLRSQKGFVGIIRSVPHTCRSYCTGMCARKG